MEQHDDWQQPAKHPGKGADPDKNKAILKLSRELEAGEGDWINSDESEIMQDAAAFADRDQLFGSDKHQLAAQNDTGEGDDWPGEQEELILGERDTNKDLLDEIEEVSHNLAVETNHSIHTAHPWPAPPKDFDLGLDQLSDAELHSRAHALGVLDSDRMHRSELMMAIRQTLLDSLEEVMK